MLLSATNIVKAKLINIWVVFEAIRIRGRSPAPGIAEATERFPKQAVSGTGG